MRPFIAPVVATALLVGCAANSTTAENQPIRPEPLELEQLLNSSLQFNFENSPTNINPSATLDLYDLPGNIVRLQGNITDENGATDILAAALIERSPEQASYIPHELLPSDVDEVLRSIAYDLEPIISLAAQELGLNKIVFQAGKPEDDNRHSYYNHIANSVVVRLSGQDTTYEELVATTQHELMHVLGNRFVYNTNDWDEPFWEEACGTLERSELGDIRNNIADLAATVDEAAIEAGDTEVHTTMRSIRRFLQARRDGNITYLTNCGAPTSGYILSDIASAAGADPTAINRYSFSDTSTFRQLDRETRFRMIKEVDATGTWYEKVSESNFMHPNSRLGHPEDNFDELLATIQNDLVGFPEELGQEIAAMTPEEQAVVRMLIDLVCDGFADMPAWANVLRANKEVVFAVADFAENEE